MGLAALHVGSYFSAQGLSVPPAMPEFFNHSTTREVPAVDILLRESNSLEGQLLYRRRVGEARQGLVPGEKAARGVCPSLGSWAPNI